MKKSCSCGSSFSTTDLDTGEVCCSKCGTVSKEEHENNGSSKSKALSENTATKSQYDETNREGGMKGFLRKDSKIVDSKNVKISGANKAYFERISDEGNYWKTSLEKYSDVKRNKTFECMKHIFSKRKIPEYGHMFDDGVILYEKLVKNKIDYRKNYTILAIMCVYHACKNHNYNITLEEISGDINENSETIIKKIKNIEKTCRTSNIKINNQGIDKIRLIQQQILKFPNKILSENFKRKAAVYFPYEKIENIISSSKKESVASGIINIISRENDLNVTTKKIAQVYGISEFSVRSLSKKIQEALVK